MRSIVRFHEQARRFRGNLENRVPTPEDLRREVSELVAEAQSVESALRYRGGRAELETEWRSIGETLERMRSEVGV